MNRAERLFAAVVWLAVIVNLSFAIPALFAPDMLLASLGLGPEAGGVWLGNAGMLLLTLCLFYIPSRRPSRHPTYAKVMVVGRGIASIFWIGIWRTSAQPAIFKQFFWTDFTFFLVLGILLHWATPEEYRGVRATFRSIGQGFQGAGAFWRRPVVRITLAVLVIAGALVGYGLWKYLLRREPDTQYASDEDHFKHGAIGLSAQSRFPYWVFRVLPGVFADKLPGPGGWASFGFIIEPGNDVPIGFSLRHQGYPALEANCSLCHTSTYRKSASDTQHVILGAPAHTLDLESFQHFLYDCAADPRFTPANVVDAIQRVHPMGWFEAAVYRNMIVPVTRYGLLKQRQDYAWQYTRPTQGRGRVDTFNPTKFNVYHMPDDGTIGTVDLPQIWNQRPRQTLYLHWDGNNNNIHERNYAAAMAVGGTPKSVIAPSFNRVTNFLLDLKPTQYPFDIDQAKAEKGHAIYERECANCHEFGRPATGQVTDIGQIGTDRHRLDSFTQGLVDKFHSINFGPPFKFDSYRKTNGYSDTPLDGIWARAPYLHNGSVPTLWDLLEAPEKRPAVFYTGFDVYDPRNVGFVSAGPEAERAGFRYDIRVPGNGNEGHLYGASLTAEQKWELVEFMKAL